MGRMATRLNQTLEVKVPSFFQCPISLELMRSPVILCTGVTYDRSSIQPWLDSGHTTCPATMQPLRSTDLVPNLTLRRLIHHWSSSAHQLSNLLASLNSSNPIPSLDKLTDFFSDPNVDSSLKNSIFSSSCDTVAAMVTDECNTEVAEASVRIIKVRLTMDDIEDISKRELLSNLYESISSIISVMKKGSTIESRIDAARVFDAVFLLSDQEMKSTIADTPGLVDVLISFIGDGEAAEAGIACLIRVSETGRRVVSQMVQSGLVGALVRFLTAEGVPAAATEGAMRLMETTMGCVEGRAAVREVAEECVGAVVGRMMKVGREGKEAAVAVLWRLSRDQRARAAVAGASGGLAKILVLMQGECSPAARRMAGELLRVFLLDRKICLAAYDTKTTHIMPF